MPERYPHFSYSGRLVFNGIYQTEVREKNLTLEKILSRVPRFEKGTPESPGSGYEIHDIEDYAEINNITPEILTQQDEQVLLRYRYEEFDWEEALVDGALEEVATRSIDEVDLFWSYPDYLFIRGSQNVIDTVQKDIQRAFGGGVRLNQLEFDFRFLLWIFYKQYIGERIDNELAVHRLTDAETRDENTQKGEIKRFTGSEDVTQSTSVLTDLLRILRGKELAMIGGEFDLYGNKYSANISSDGRVEIKTQYDVAKKTDLERMALSIAFLTKITNLYSDWETRGQSDKYPPEEFFEDIKTNIENQGVDAEFNLDETLIPYYIERDDNEF